MFVESTRKEEDSLGNDDESSEDVNMLDDCDERR